MRTHIRETFSVRTLATRLAVGVATAALLAACSETADIVRPTEPSGGPIFERYVALGNSITAGLQSGGINDSTQRQSYAALFAAQAGTDYAFVGIPIACLPPTANFQTGAKIAVPAGSACALPSAAPAFINNVAVPDATAADAFTPYTSASNPFTSFILGGKSQAARALDANPTFVSVWLGNNEVLGPSVRGLLTATPGVTPGLTPLSTFASNFDQALAILDEQQGLRGALIGVVNVTNAPILFPIAALYNPQFRAGFEQFAGGPVTLAANCSPTTTSLLAFAIIPQIRDNRADPTKGHPPIIACEKNADPTVLVGNIFVLDSEEQATVAQVVSDYNAHIAAAAEARGWAYFDPNPVLTDLRQRGLVPVVPNLASATEPYGPFISLDGVHPSGLAHQLIANSLIDAVNDTYGTSVPKLPDPLASTP